MRRVTVAMFSMLVAGAMSGAATAAPPSQPAEPTLLLTYGFVDPGGVVLGGPIAEDFVRLLSAKGFDVRATFDASAAAPAILVEIEGADSDDIEVVQSNLPTKIVVHFRPIVKCDSTSDAADDATTTINVFGAEETSPDSTETLFDRAGQACVVGPQVADGFTIEKAQAVVSSGGWWVEVALSDDAYLDPLRQLVEDCARVWVMVVESCPTGQIAVVANGTIMTAPRPGPDYRLKNEIALFGLLSAADAPALAAILNASASIDVIELEEIQATEGADTVPDS